VEDGQTVILAGLLSEERTHTIYKVPILGQIPVLGLLFQHKREEVKKSNLIIEVVPRIIHDPAEISKYMSIQLFSGDGKKGKRRGSRRAARVPAV
jgi:type II secretory pathway component GspD/PulD (secretin)